MKRLLPLVFIILISCGKDSTNPESKPDGIVNYFIEGDSMHIVDSASNSGAKWIYSNGVSEGYGLQAYYAKPGGEVLYMLSFFIETDKIEAGRNYVDGVTGTILRNDTDYASANGMQDTYIIIYVSKKQDNTLSGRFKARLQNLNTHEFFDVSGSFENVKLIQ